MSIKLTRLVIDNYNLPLRLKPLLVLLAFTSRNDDGTGIYTAVEKLAQQLGVKHRETVSKWLAEAEQLGFVRTIHRGGRRSSAKGVVRGIKSQRALVVETIAAFGCNSPVTKQAHLVTGRLHSTDAPCNSSVTHKDYRAKRKTVETKKDLSLMTSTPSPAAPASTDGDYVFLTGIDRPGLEEQIDRASGPRRRRPKKGAKK
jgi:hypothetical protein